MKKLLILFVCILASTQNIAIAEESHEESRYSVQAKAIVDIFMQFDVPREGNTVTYVGFLPGGSASIHWRTLPFLSLGLAASFVKSGNISYFDFSARTGFIFSAVQDILLFKPCLSIGLVVPNVDCWDCGFGASHFVVGGELGIWVMFRNGIGISLEMLVEYMVGKYSTVILRPSLGVVYTF